MAPPQGAIAPSHTVEGRFAAGADFGQEWRVECPASPAARRPSQGSRSMSMVRLALRGVGDVLAAGQVPDEPRVDVAKEQVARLGERTAPLEHCRASSESWDRRNRWRAADLPCDRRGPHSVRFQLPADAIGARILPDDGIVDRLGRCARFQRTAVSRWFVTPMAAMSPAVTPATRRVVSITSHVHCQISGRIVFHPSASWDRSAWCSRWSKATTCRPGGRTA